MNPNELFDLLSLCPVSILTSIINNLDIKNAWLSDSQNPVTIASELMTWDKHPDGGGNISRLLLTYQKVVGKPTQTSPEIPFVTVAMTDIEAQELNKKLESEDFNAKFKTLLEIRQVIADGEKQEFLQNYSGKRFEWKPYSEIDLTIQEIIENTINGFSDIYYEESSSITHCEYSERCFDTDDNIRNNTWEYLRDSGCILIIDPISLFCEHICKCLMDAEILSNENTGVAIIMPKNSNILEVDKLIKEASKDTPLSRAYKRFEDNFDINCEIGIRNKLNLERWCFSILPKMVGIIEKNKPMATNKKNRKERLEKITKKTDTPMGNLIFGNKVNKL